MDAGGNADAWIKNFWIISYLFERKSGFLLKRI